MVTSMFKSVQAHIKSSKMWLTSFAFNICLRLCLLVVGSETIDSTHTEHLPEVHIAAKASSYNF